ncbi:Ig-like domain-containing protein [Bacillus sp. ISL-7]|uniref:Ig-like domain-containing protein n=1 Tax=Bacillus sp. ISL-7 TaxID=2819136 RepID=UPI001BE9E0C3|nr:Ig-like domain-containing protein [Bacillus sp. ISL-7]MBT2736199.1 Ig-like domain-containing protein [Bacillus sp. ISL-7]
MNRKALLATTLAALLTVSPATSFAESNNQTTSTTSSSTTTKQTLAQLSVASVSPENKSSGIRPDAPIKVVLGDDEKAGVFERGRYQVTINGEQVSSTYDVGSRTINIPHDVFNRYSTYTITVTTDQKFFAFNFKTGSEIGEATHLSISPEQTKVRTTDNGKIDVVVTDDYGQPAKNASVKVTSDSANLSATSVSITPESNGKGIIELTDHKKEVVNLTVTSNDGIYRDAVNTKEAGATVEFLAGHPAKAIRLTDSVQAGKTTDVKFEVFDRYGNLVENDEALTLAFQNEDFPTLQSSPANGVVSFPFEAPTKTQSINVAFSAVSNGFLYMPSPLQVVPAEASKATILLSKEQPLNAREEVHAQGQLTDQYGNIIANKEISFGELGTATTDSNGNYDFGFTVPANLTEIGLQVDGNLISLFLSNGETVETLPIQVLKEISQVEDFENDSNIFNITGSWFKTQSSNSTTALRSAYIGNYGSSSSEFTVSVPENAVDASLSLDYLVSSEPCCDIFSISIDGQLVVNEAGSYYSDSWKNITHNLSPGNHVVMLTYRKDGSVAYGSDAAFIDNIRLYYHFN